MGQVIPTMKTWRGSQIIVDVKGNLFNYWKVLNKNTGKKIKVFSPGTLDDSSCGYDPYAPLRRGDIVGNARILALALMPLLPSNQDPVWIKAAQNYLTSAIIYCFGIGCSFIETMSKIQLTFITEMIDVIKDSDNMIAKVYMNKLKEVQKKVITNIGMELSNIAGFVTDPAIYNVFRPDAERDLIDWADLNSTTEPLDIILEFPEVNLERWEPMILLVINQLIKSLEQRSERTHVKNSELPPVLVMLDEFPRLGKISAIKNGLATLRSRGVTFALFVQSLANLDETYGSATARVITDICSFKVILGVSDPVSQEYFSDAVGTTESNRRGFGFNFEPVNGMIASYSGNISEIREPIIYQHEFLTLKDVVVINPFNGFCRVDKILFHEHREVFLGSQPLQNQEDTTSIPSLTLIAKKEAVIVSDINKHLKTTMIKIVQEKNQRDLKKNREKEAKKKKEDSRYYEFGRLICKYFPEVDVETLECFLRVLAENQEIFEMVKEEAAKYELQD